VPNLLGSHLNRSLGTKAHTFKKRSFVAAEAALLQGRRRLKSTCDS